MKLGWSTYIIMIVSLSSLQEATGCQRTELDNGHGVCVLALHCDRQIRFDHTSFDCIRNEEWISGDDFYNNDDIDDEGYMKISYSTDYILYVTVQNADDNHDIFEHIETTKNIEELEVSDGYMNVIPQKIFQLNGVKKIVFINNRLSMLNLNAFSALPKATSIVLQNNSIATLEMGSQTLYSASRSIQQIDLSQNLLKSIPKICFSLFTEMKFLNLSHNMIHSFDILSFEGVLGLRSLDVSFNQIIEFGNSFTRFMNLNELYLQNNNLTIISDYNLSTLIRVQKLNLSSNFIKSIENKTFKSLVDLEYLDMSNNKIEKITKVLFENNSKLQSLILNNNHISHIEDRAFERNNITELNLKNNHLNITIKQDTLKGIHVAELDLSNGFITSLGNESFKYMSENLTYVNVSSNKITSISHSAFASLDFLSTLDLSHNLLEELTFETSSLNNLTFLYAQNNYIKIVTKSVFDNLHSLNELDLSYNKINAVELKCFWGLKEVERLSVANNPFVNSLQNNTFAGLIRLKTINLSYTRTSSFQNESFSSLPNLRHVNSSHGILSTIEYDTFLRTGSIEILDLSHNLLENFNVNMSSNQNIEEIYLNDNAIRLITNNTFSGLQKLRILNLANNAIRKMEINAFGQLLQLSYLSLSANTQMEIIGESFNNLPNLYQLSLDNIKTRFTFQNASAQMVNIDLRSCGITDLNNLFIYNVKKLQELNLSTNAITKVDKFSFQDMSFLIMLDLSCNMINFIQPGSFIHVSDLRSLNLFGNNIQILRYGTFDGAQALSFVNLSSNALQRFDPRLLPIETTLALDNNNINELGFVEFFKRETKKLSIGGNPISCNVFLELKISNYSEKFKSVLTTANLDFHSENVDGISCQSVPKENGTIFPIANNTTAYDIRPAFNQFSNAIQYFRSSIELLKQNASQDESEIKKIVNSIQTMISLSNQTNKNANDYLKQIKDLTNSSQIYIKEFVLQLFNRTVENTVNHQYIEGKVSSKDRDEIRIEMKKLLKDEIEVIREEFEKSFQKRGVGNQAQIIEKESKEDKVHYFIAACLGIIIVLYIINVTYKLIKKKRTHISRKLHVSTRPSTSEIEME